MLLTRPEIRLIYQVRSVNARQSTKFEQGDANGRWIVIFHHRRHYGSFRARGNDGGRCSSTRSRALLVNQSSGSIRLRWRSQIIGRATKAALEGALGCR